VKKLGAQILEISFLIELKFLNGREKLKDYPVPFHHRLLNFSKRM